jgi:hypothetical protein
VGAIDAWFQLDALWISVTARIVHQQQRVWHTGDGVSDNDDLPEWHMKSKTAGSVIDWPLSSIATRMAARATGRVGGNDAPFWADTVDIIVHAAVIHVLVIIGIITNVVGQIDGLINAIPNRMWPDVLKAREGGNERSTGQLHEPEWTR